MVADRYKGSGAAAVSKNINFFTGVILIAVYINAVYKNNEHSLIINIINTGAVLKAFSIVKTMICGTYETIV